MEARCAVDPVVIEQRQRRIPERERAIDERFGQRGRVEKRKCRSRVELDVFQGR
jgi:hypothetical protein